MNWYKKAKLIDKKSPLDEKSMFTQCSYCQSWATIDDQGNLAWKEILNPEEERSKSRGHISHGICPDCWEIMEEQGFLTDPDKIKDISKKRKLQLV